ncbi:DEAD/DEAH box helicase [Pelomonas sp. KK5]|uniref:DEAD/DEAH box helicase n=1 Tax=Pelomonas sp. KK5 TaxID=1855730 RepID=UPI001E2C9D62|nr:DEAD/DEAH box helicase [Pelomonas sp. KK5]
MSATAPDLTETRLWPPEEAQLQRLFERARLQRGRVLLTAIVDIDADAAGAVARVRGGGALVHELAVQGVRDARGRPHYSALCSCSTGRFCEHAAAVMLKLQAQADAPRREQLLQLWLDALRRKAGREELKSLPRLPEADAARLMDLLMEDGSPAPPTAPAPIAETPPEAEPATFRPRLTLRTLGRGDGLLGLQRGGTLGPRGDSVTIAEVDWTYRCEDGHAWSTPAPRSLLNSRPAATVEIAPGRRIARDLGAEADARDQLWSLGLLPLDPAQLQWRDPAAEGPSAPWTLLQEEFFGPFWTERVPALQQQGWAVVALPGFTHRPVQPQGWTARLEPLAGSARSGSWLLSLGVEVDGETLDLAPMIATLLRHDARWTSAEAIAGIDDDAIILLTAPGGRQIEAPAGVLKPILSALLDLLADTPEGPIVISEWDATRLTQVEDHSLWRFFGDGDLRRMAHRLLAAGSPPPVEPPAGLGLELRPYQLAGLAWLQYLRAHDLAGILADDMGLGKTAQTLAHLLLEKQAGRLDRPALAVLPTSLLFNWRAEAARITPDLSVLVLHGPARAVDFSRLQEFDLVLTTYPLLWRDIAELQRQRWHLLILDEAQTVKNAASRAARAARKLPARHRLCLTGTPLENNLAELWAQFDFLMPGFLGDSRGFQRRWRKPIETNGESLRAQLLAQRVRPFILRRSKDQVATELPPLTTVVRRVQLEGAQRELYESVRVAADKQVRRVLAQKGFGGALVSVLDALLKLRQVCCDARLLREGAEGRAKLDLLMDMLPELLDEGRRVLVFSQFTTMLDLVAAELDARRLGYLTLTGATPVAQRAGIVGRFQAGESALMLVSLKAGGVGLNLTAADTVIQLDPWWNPAVEAQAAARAHRIGQDRPVFVYKLVVAGSIEERMLELQARKEALAARVLGVDAADAPKFSAEDLDLLLAPLA